MPLNFGSVAVFSFVVVKDGKNMTVMTGRGDY
jgi:hypothetical protein